MKKSDFEMVCRAYDRVGFFFLFHVSRVTQYYQMFGLLTIFLKLVYFYKHSLIDSIFSIIYKFKCQQLRQYIKKH